MSYCPIIISPEGFDFPHKNEVNHFGGNISQEEASLPPIEKDTKKAVVFVGGLCDSLSRVLFSSFYEFTCQDACKFYSTYDGIEYFLPIFETLYKMNLEISVIGHSWGAASSITALSKNHTPLEYFITLDSVSCTPPVKLEHIKCWENIYVNDHFSFNLSNIVALIGHPQGSIKFADINTGLNPPCTHEQVWTMLEASKLFKLLHNPNSPTPKEDQQK